MNKLILLLMFVNIPVMASPYKYPSLIKYDASCNASPKVISEIKNKFPTTPHCTNNEVKITSVDLNNDNKCEYFITYDWGRRCTPVTEIVTYEKNTIKSIGEVKGGPINSFGTKKNGYVRLINYTWGGHRTAMIFTTNILSFDGEKYICEFCKDNSHGGYIDLARKKYDRKQYDEAELYYWNAYAMNGERKISDANNLALVKIKRKQYKPAIKLLNKHLRYSKKEIIDTEKYPCYSSNCTPSYKRVKKLRASAYYNRGLAYEKMGYIKNAIIDFNASLKEKPNKSINERIKRLKKYNK